MDTPITVTLSIDQARAVIDLIEQNDVSASQEMLLVEVRECLEDTISSVESD